MRCDQPLPLAASCQLLAARNALPSPHLTRPLVVRQHSSKHLGLKHPSAVRPGSYPSLQKQEKTRTGGRGMKWMHPCGGKKKEKSNPRSASRLGWAARRPAFLILRARATAIGPFIQDRFAAVFEALAYGRCDAYQSKSAVGCSVRTQEGVKSLTRAARLMIQKLTEICLYSLLRHPRMRSCGDAAPPHICATSTGLERSELVLPLSLFQRMHHHRPCMRDLRPLVYTLSIIPSAVTPHSARHQIRYRTSHRPTGHPSMHRGAPLTLYTLDGNHTHK